MEYRNAVYTNVENTYVDCEINHAEFGWIPYTLDPTDTDMTVNNDDLFAAMVSNADVGAYVPSTQAEIDAERQANINQTSREYLESTDWYIPRSLETGVAVPEEVTAGRAAARAAIIEE